MYIFLVNGDACKLLVSHNLFFSRPFPVFLTFFILVLQGACLALDAGRLLKCLEKVCAFHNLPSATEFERLPVGTGSNPVSSSLAEGCWISH